MHLKTLTQYYDISYLTFKNVSPRRVHKFYNQFSPTTDSLHNSFFANTPNHRFSRRIYYITTTFLCNYNLSFYFLNNINLVCFFNRYITTYYCQHDHNDKNNQNHPFINNHKCFICHIK